MKQTGILATCERCGKTEFFADKSTEPAILSYDTSGWRNVWMDNNVCPKCYEYYIELRGAMLENFWRLKKEEEKE